MIQWLYVYLELFSCHCYLISEHFDHPRKEPVLIYSHSCPAYSPGNH